MACLLAAVPRAVLPAQTQDKGKVVEEVVARVNNDVITRGDLDTRAESLAEEAQQDCPTCTPAQINEKVAAAAKDLAARPDRQFVAWCSAARISESMSTPT